jgi:hypothetical protein
MAIDSIQNNRHLISSLFNLQMHPSCSRQFPSVAMKRRIVCNPNQDDETVEKSFQDWNSDSSDQPD